MVFGLDGETLIGGIKRGALGNRPRSQDPFHFETEVVMKPRGAMFLDNKRVAGDSLNLAFRFRRLIEAAFAFVLLEAHV
jgi:hypothetical protein